MFMLFLFFTQFILIEGMCVSSFILFLLKFQVLVPSESKTLHLYEARYLGLLEEVLYRLY